jgi:hypothetical protein
MPHRKITATRGLVWFAQAARLVWSTSQPLIPIAMWISVGMFMPVLSFFTLILLCVLYGGAVTALHKKVRLGHAGITDLFNGFKSLHHFLGLWILGLPIIGLALVASITVINAIGPETMELLAKSQGQRPDPKVIEPLVPVIAAGLLKMLPLAALVFWLIFIAVPRVVLDNRSGMAALWDAVRALYSNFLAVFLFSFVYAVVMIITLFVLAIPVGLLLPLGTLGIMAQAAFVMFLMSLGIIMYLTGMYCAWLDMYPQPPEHTDQKNAAQEKPPTQKTAAQIEV